MSTSIIPQSLALVDIVYPVGSIYMSTSSTSPELLFGGTWEQIKDTFLLSAGDSYNNGDTGGEAAHTLTTAELPSHTHSLNSHTHGPGSYATNTVGNHTHGTVMGQPPTNWVADGTSNYGATGFQLNGQTAGAGSHSHSVNSGTSGAASGNTGNTGEGAAHNNMPPYLVVNVWKRTA